MDYRILLLSLLLVVPAQALSIVNVSEGISMVEGTGIILHDASYADYVLHLGPHDDSQIIASQGISVSKASIALEKQVEIDYIGHCLSFDFTEEICLGWEQTGIAFTQNDTHVIFEASDISGYFAGALRPQVCDASHALVSGGSYLFASDCLGECTLSLGGETMPLGIYDVGSHSSYEITCVREGYFDMVHEGTIEADLDGDGFPGDADCDDLDPFVHPGAEEILYNLKDDDCSQTTPDELSVSLAADRTSYKVGQTALIIVSATASADTYMTVEMPDNRTFIYSYSNASYPRSVSLALNRSGTYTARALTYMGLFTTQDTLSFQVESDLDAEIDANETSIQAKDSVKFDADVSGGIPPYTYRWDFDDGTTSDLKSPVHAFNADRTHDVVLKVTDSAGNSISSTERIKVQTKFRVVIKVTDDAGTALKYADVEIGDDEERTNTSGQVEFMLSNKTYELDISHKNFTSLSGILKVNSSHILSYRLEKDQSAVFPEVSLISPKDKEELQGGVKFSFSFKDNSEAVCTLYTSGSERWWTQEKKFSKASGSQLTHEKSYDDEATYLWKVSCIDTDGNEGWSQESSFKIVKPAVPEETFTEVQDIYDQMADLDTYSPDQKRLAQLLGLDVRMKGAKFELDKANRDLFNLRYRKDIADVYQEQQEIMQRIDSIKDTTPRLISIIDKTEYVKYIGDDDAKVLLEAYIDQTGQDSSLVGWNIELQKKATISVEAYTVELEHISGRKERRTVIYKRAEMPDDAKLVEHPSRSGFEIITQGAVADGEFLVAPARELAYQYDEELDLSGIPASKAFAFSEKQVREDKLTGFSVFDGVGLGKGTGFFIIQMVVIAGLVVFILRRRSPQPVSIYDDALNNLEEIEKMVQEEDPCAAERYAELSVMFHKLTPAEKRLLADRISRAAEAITVSYSDSLLDSMFLEFNKGNVEQAKKLYCHLKETYENLPPKAKKRIALKLEKLGVGP